MIALTLFFDGHCAFCAAEMRSLQRWDRAGKLAFVDIAAPDFSAAILGVEYAALDLALHSLTADGAVLVGIDSILAAYTLVGRAWLVAPLRVRALRPLMAYLYRQFARHRYQISAWLGYAPPCRDGVCQRPLF
ncbi:putative DCC family thiol-disulfide oxidoreductase YuxK [Oxalobacteraceae bacterium GrIS 1.11]